MRPISRGRAFMNQLLGVYPRLWSSRVSWRIWSASFQSIWFPDSFKKSRFCNGSGLGWRVNNHFLIFGEIERFINEKCGNCSFFCCLVNQKQIKVISELEYERTGFRKYQMDCLVVVIFCWPFCWNLQFVLLCQKLKEKVSKNFRKKAIPKFLLAGRIPRFRRCVASKCQI